MFSDDMGDNLGRYYAWARVNNPADIGYPHQTPFRRLRGGSIGSEGLSDDEARLLDRALCALGADNPEALWMVRRYHQDRKSLRWLEARGYGGRKRNGRLLSEAHQFVRGFLSAQAA